MRRTLAAIAGLAALSLAAPGHASALKGGEEEKPADNSVDVSPMALPVIVDGRIANFVFVMMKLGLTPAGDAAKARAAEPFLRDALLKSAYRTPLNAADLVSLDEARLKATVRSLAAARLGPKAVAGVTVVSQSPLRRRAMGVAPPAQRSVAARNVQRSLANP